MSDILSDAREFIGDRHERIQTHSDGCWRWHPACMVARLARELEQTREYRDLAESDAAVARLAADESVRLAAEVRRLRAALVAVATQDGTLSVSEGRLFVDVAGVEELAFDYATSPPHPTTGEGREQEQGTCEQR